MILELSSEIIYVFKTENGWRKRIWSGWRQVKQIAESFKYEVDILGDSSYHGEYVKTFLFWKHLKKESFL